MKYNVKSLVTVFAFLITFKSISQIPNAGFENWTTFSSWEDPTGWTSYNSVSAPTGTFTCLKSSPGFIGNHYVSLLTQTISPSGILHGIVGTGIPFLGNMNTFKGYPFTNQPATINGQWQHAAPTSSTSSNCYISVYLSKWNSSILKRDTICYYKAIITGTNTSWTAFSINLASGYMSAVNPDSCVIIMRSHLTSNASLGSYLNIDDLSFNGTVTDIADIKNMTDFNVYPNPSHGQINFVFSKLTTQKEITIIDGLGHEVLTTSSDKIDSINLPNGLYTIKVNVEGKVGYKKFVKN